MARILVLLLCALLVGADEEVSEGGKCERIRLPLCQDLGYNWTAMPNLLGHKDQKEAEAAMASFADILSSGCSEHARFVVCSAFAPLCSEEVSGAVSACRAVCEGVLEQCRARLRPAAFDCTAFPLRPDRRLCMRPPNASEPEPEPAPAPAPPRWRDLSTPAPAPCADSRADDLWVSAFAWMSLLSTTFALLTFCAEPARYRYPERPAVWTAACHLCVALAYAARGWLGARAAPCGDGAGGVAEPPGPACVAFFSVTYYFTLAADAWFANACVSWYLTAASEWSTEALERGGAYLHAVAWGWAGAWTAAALALRRVSGAECGVAAGGAPALLAVPRGALLVAGAALGAAAAPGVLRVRRALGGRGARRVGRLAARAALGAALYLALAAGSTAAQVAGGAGAGATCAALACGAAAAGWACSRKSAQVWRRALCPPRKAPPAPPAPPLLRPQHPYYKRPLHMSRV